MEFFKVRREANRGTLAVVLEFFARSRNDENAETSRSYAPREFLSRVTLATKRKRKSVLQIDRPRQDYIGAEEMGVIGYLAEDSDISIKTWPVLDPCQFFREKQVFNYTVRLGVISCN